MVQSNGDKLMSELRNNYRNIAGQTRRTVVRYLTDDGTGITGDRNILGDYSIVSKDFWIQPPSDELWIVREVGGVVDGIATSQPGSYGSINGGLTNGLRFFIELNGFELDATGSSNYKTNEDLVSNGTRFVALKNELDRFYLPTIVGTDTLVLNGETNDKFIVRVNDDFTMLTTHNLYVHAENYGPRGR